MTSCTGALRVDPPVCPVPAEGGVSKHKLINQTDQKLAFKVNSSNNSNYTVSLVSGFVEVGKTVDFAITRVKGKPKADKLVIMFAGVGSDVTDSMKPFASGKPEGEVSGSTVIKLSAAE